MLQGLWERGYRKEDATVVFVVIYKDICTNTRSMAMVEHIVFILPGVHHL